MYVAAIETDKQSRQTNEQNRIRPSYTWLPSVCLLLFCMRYWLERGEHGSNVLRRLRRKVRVEPDNTPAYSRERKIPRPQVSKDLALHQPQRRVVLVRQVLSQLGPTDRDDRLLRQRGRLGQLPRLGEAFMEKKKQGINSVTIRDGPCMSGCLNSIAEPAKEAT